jgi:hypothetical protein
MKEKAEIYTYQLANSKCKHQFVFLPCNNIQGISFNNTPLFISLPKQNKTSACMHAQIPSFWGV